MRIKVCLFIALAVLLLPLRAIAANHYICDTDVCGQTPGDGLTWAAALDDLPTSFTRGDTYYVADGIYTSHVFSQAVSGSSLITVKKATVADHGSETGWNNSWGDGQAVFSEYIQFTSNYWVFDGNGTHTTPSSNTNDYGFKVSSTRAPDSASYLGVIRFGGSGSTCSYVTLRYVHSFNTYNHTNGNWDLTNHKYYPTSSNTYIKVQNCLVDGSGSDGIQINRSSYILYERCHIRLLGEHGDHGIGACTNDGLTGDCHGQAIQLSGGGTDIVFRYNRFESCEGESMWSIFGPTGSPARLRFYGNIVYNPYGVYTASSGYNAGIIHYWNEGGGSLAGIYVYNNTITNIGGSYDMLDGSGSRTAIWYLAADATDAYIYNNLVYNNSSNTASNWDGHGYHASGVVAAGGTNEQTGLTTAIFTIYTGNDFRIAANTDNGITLSSQGWWSGGVDAFFGTVDSAVDMYGTTRSTWSRGAYEYGTGGGSTPLPSATNLRMNNATLR